MHTKFKGKMHNIRLQIEALIHFVFPTDCLINEMNIEIK